MSSRAGSGSRAARHAPVDVVFDGRCGFCTLAVARLQRLDRRGSITAYPFQRPGVLERFGLTSEEAQSAAWAFDATARFRGAGAAARALDAALGVRLCVPLYRVPPLRLLADRAYRWVADNRSRLRGSAPWCVQHPADCAR